ncbi:MAG: magnesium protoporphyrin IX methyltransferase [Alphaproteobacteria bacterium]|jgi:magnesium-protoporphyrin O-methyltransferase
MSDYTSTLARVEDYFDRSATKVWERLTSDAPVSRIRQTVREGRDRMRALMLSRMPADLHGMRVLDAGCGAGQMTAEMAARGADVVAVDISPALVDIARNRLPAALAHKVTFASGDMTADHGRFDHVVAMDSLIYYNTRDITAALQRLGERTGQSVIFTVAPRTAFLMTFWTMGKVFPRSDRSPIMVPHAFHTLNDATETRLTKVARVSRGFYISECLEYRP